MLFSAIPTEYILQEFWPAMFYYLSFVVFFTSARLQLVFLTSCFAVTTLVINPVVRNHEPDSLEVFGPFMLVLLFFFLCNGTAMVVTYISELHNKMNTTIEDNEKLLDGMHEGLLILSKDKQAVMFGNKPAKKLLKTFVEIGDCSHAELLAHNVFKPIKIFKQEIFTVKEENHINMEAIIIMQQDEPK